MCCSKTTTLGAAYESALAHGQPAEFWTHELDTREPQGVSTHDGEVIGALKFASTVALLDRLASLPRGTLVCLDELQFFDVGILELPAVVARTKCSVMAAGLDYDFMGRPFGYTLELAKMAHTELRLTARCHADCLLPAIWTSKLTTSMQLVEVGGKDIYAPRCTQHFEAGFVQ